MSCEHEPTNAVSPIIEGLCPRCMVALERSEDHGLCPCCNIGWAITPDSVTVVLNIDGFTAHTSAGTLRGGPGSVRSTRSLKRGGD